MSILDIYQCILVLIYIKLLDKIILSVATISEVLKNILKTSINHAQKYS